LGNSRKEQEAKNENHGKLIKHTVFVDGSIRLVFMSRLNSGMF